MELTAGLAQASLITRRFTTPGVNPLDQVTWTRRDAWPLTGDPKADAGITKYHNPNVLVPVAWRQNDLDITSKLYLSKADEVERKSVRRLIERVMSKITLEAIRHGFVDAGTLQPGLDAGSYELPGFPDLSVLDRDREDLLTDPFWAVMQEDNEAAALYAELCYIAVNQMGAFNSPVWFNVGRPDRIQQVSACYILGVEDNTLSLTETNTRNAFIFKYGSGAGYNLSRVRGSMEELSTGGIASGPLSFRRMYDATNGTFKSGGMTRRAAELVCMDDDHPDVLEFIEVKPREERRMADLIKAGHNLGMDEEGERNVAECTAYQNANMSVRFSDAFMRKVVGEDPGPMWELRARTGGEVVQTVDARELYRRVCEAAHACADPGVQYHDHFNAWHTTPTIDGLHSPIRSTNPCFPAGTRIHTDKGLMPIEEIVRLGELGVAPAVYMHRATGDDGNGGVLKAEPVKFWRNGHADLLRLTFSDGRQIRCTPNHRFWTDKGWVAAEDLVHEEHEILLNDSVTQTAVTPHIPVVALREVGVGRGGVGVAERQMPRVWTQEIGEVLGHLVGDGCLTDRQATWVYGGDDVEDGTHIRHSEILTQMADSIGIHMGDAEMGNGTRQLRVASGAMRSWLQDLGISKAKAHEKRVPWSIMAAPSDIQAAFLRGLYGADGCVTERISRKCNRYVGLASSSEMLLRDVQTMLSTFGLRARLYKVRDAGRSVFEYKGKTYVAHENWDLRLSGTDMEVFAKLIGFSTPRKQGALESILETSTRYQTKRGVRITERCTDGREEVFNISLPLYHSYIAEGLVVANCGEYASNDDTSCNLASLNVLKFVPQEPEHDGEFYIDDFRHAVDVMVVAMDTLVELSDFPDDPERGGKGKFRHYTTRLRQLGLGYANLGAALMAQGMPYDSDEGRDWAASITALMTGRAYRMSGQLAHRHGAFDCWEENREAMLGVVKRHKQALPMMYEGELPVDHPKAAESIWRAAREDWQVAENLGLNGGYRNAQATVLAPTGSISYLMGCDSTGCEPVFSKVTIKTLAGGGTVVLVADCVQAAAGVLGGYSEGNLKSMAEGDFSCISDEDQAIFHGANEISVEGHIRMLGALQPFISGGISKTVNMAREATVDDVADAYLLAWKLGVKNVAIYRDGSKVRQVLTSAPAATKEEAKAEKLVPEGVQERARREMADITTAVASSLDDKIAAEVSPRMRMPRTRQAIIHKIHVKSTMGEHEGYVMAGVYPDGRLGELFIEGFGKQGSFTQNALAAWATDFSIALQYGVPFEVLVGKHAWVSDETGGVVVPPTDGSVMVLTSCKSIVDYVARWLVAEFGDTELQSRMGVMTDAVKKLKTEAISMGVDWGGGAGSDLAASISTNGHARQIEMGPPCMDCGKTMHRAGSCWACACGNTTGCG